ncbi:uncharacterized protein LOC109835572 [Asparagus officinalis]|uniref:uncharacterized protein LOC109835572 n=1 Tax=Asparagus officinalis TaxID=4686 RepID=UPI00098E7E25|nr:uncharacterized protein LOC109835572 [Asparagus officinalis]
MALIETKVKVNKLSAIAKKLHSNWKWISNANNSSKVRLLILWDPNTLDVNVDRISTQHITCSVKSLDGRIDCLITSIYGHNHQENRKALWQDLSQIQQTVGNKAWILSGDFNAITGQEDKIGGLAVIEAETTDFRDFIDNCHLSHLKTEGCYYTWNNKQDSNFRVWSKLDRTLVNDSWNNLHNSSHVEYLPPRCAMFSVASKLKLLKNALKDLNKRSFHNISEKVIRARFNLENVQNKLQGDPLNTDLINQENECFALYNKLLDFELSFYHQKSRIHWNVHGDRCTSFFHSVIKVKRHLNRVSVLYNNAGCRLTDGEEIIQEFISFYKNLMGSSTKTSRPDGDIISNGPCLDDAQATSLTSPVSKEDLLPANAFVRGRKISSNILLAHEIVKNYSRKNISPRNFNWDFLNDMLKGLGFPVKMVNWIMTCITTPKYSISFNGTLHGYFKGERGLRQGDPLSPYLFNLGMEYLSRQLDLLKDNKSFKFHPRCGNLKITHLIFADDLLLFSKGDLHSVNMLYNCFKHFSVVSGLEANPGKCKAFYGGIDDNLKGLISRLLNFPLGDLTITYLGVPLTCKRLSYMDCSTLFNKITGQFQNCLKNRFLSYAGRLQIIKSVILGIQNYWISNYVLPVRVLQKIDELCRNFLWGSSEQVLKTPLISWDQICLNKKFGGLDIYSASIWSMASTLRLLWNIHVNKENLWIKWKHGTYLKNYDVWHIQAKNSDSWMWRQILKVRDKALGILGSVDNLKLIIQSCCRNSKIQLSALYDAFSPVSISVPWLRGRGFKQKLKKLALTSTIYSIWNERNARIFRHELKSTDQLFTEIKFIIFAVILNGPFAVENREWLCACRLEYKRCKLY